MVYPIATQPSRSASSTDPVMAENSFSYTGYSGILRNQYVDVGVGSILLDQKAPVAALLQRQSRGGCITIR